MCNIQEFTWVYVHVMASTEEVNTLNIQVAKGLRNSCKYTCIMHAAVAQALVIWRHLNSCDIHSLPPTA